MDSVGEVKQRLARSLTSIGAFVFDRKLINSELVESILANLGISGLLSKAVMGDVVVYYVDVRLFRRKCLYEKCSMEDVIVREACLKECLMAMEREVVRTIIEVLEHST